MRKAQAGCHFLQPAEDFLLFFFDMSSVSILFGRRNYIIISSL